jgi:tyrosine-specific transport protein
MSKSSSSVFGGILLIAGSCIGAGMLGLPIQTGLSGFFPSVLSFIIVWVFMTISGFFLIEVSSWHKASANYLTMISTSLGQVGRYIGWFFYLFLFYALLVAYMAASGNILSHFFASYIQVDLRPYQATFFFVLLFGILIYKGTKTVDHANRVLMVFKIGSFLLVLFLGIKFIKPSQLSYIDSSKMGLSIPILITAFGFHNMIPSLNHYLKGNIPKVKACILGGSLLSLVIYLLWQVLILGIIPVKGPRGLQAALGLGKEASELLSQYLGHPLISLCVQLLGFFAILTSFLAQSLSLSHFLTDGLVLKKTQLHHLSACILTLLPPLILAVFYPDLFYAALNFAGGICTAVLFGIIPGLMIWKGRYVKKISTPSSQVPGGKLLVVMMLFFSFVIFIYELSSLIKSFFN